MRQCTGCGKVRKTYQKSKCQECLMESFNRLMPMLNHYRKASSQVPESARFSQARRGDVITTRGTISKTA
jgi:hypothetical protein